MDYKQILEDILELSERLCVVSGFGDIYQDDTSMGDRVFKNFNSDNFWILMGKGSEEMIIESINYHVCEVDIDGEYQFDAVLKWVPGEYDGSHVISRDYLEIAYIELKFVQTFEQRERQAKLDNLLKNDFDDFFK